MKTSTIIQKINNDFSATYKNASKFVDSGDLWNFCISTIKDPIAMGNIVFANDMGIPPVKSLITIYERKVHPTKEISALESQYMGALMGFVFKFVLGYRSQKERCTVNQLGVRTATKFLDGTVHDFEE